MSDAPTGPWQRLDPRMLLVQPALELVRFLPALLGVLLAGRATGGGLWWQALAVAVPLLLGVLRYLTTSYRVGPERVELRTGLVNRRVLSSRLERVRTVDLTATPVHRVLGVTTLRIGTGAAGDDGLDLDGLSVAGARRLREQLLRAAERPEEGDPTAAPAATEVFHGRAGWARYAPLSSTGIVVAAGVLGGGFQLADRLGLLSRLLPDHVSVPEAAALAAGVAALALACLVVFAVLAVTGYLIAYGDLRLTRTATAWHLRRGLLTVRETTLDDARLAGVGLARPLGLRAAGAATLRARMTGLDRSEPGSSLLVPPAPRAVVDRVAAAVLGTAAPLTEVLVGHGPAASRRRWARALGGTAAVLAALAAAVLLLDLARWLLLLAAPALAAAAWVARDRARSLGHDLVAGYLVVRSGSLVRRREVLATGAVIGWVLRDSWLQRRAGLVTLVATTAGGDQAVAVPDVPAGAALGLAEAASPGLLDQFRA